MKLAIPITEADGPVPTDVTKLSDEKLRDAYRLIRDELMAGHPPGTVLKLMNERDKVEREMQRRTGGLDEVVALERV